MAPLSLSDPSALYSTYVIIPVLESDATYLFQTVSLHNGIKYFIKSHLNFSKFGSYFIFPEYEIINFYQLRIQWVKLEL